MRTFLFIILSLFSASLLCGNDVPPIYLSKITPEGGVTYNSILCIEEDEMGFIWFGSNDGLFRYNSIDIKRYSHFQNDPTSISTNRINKLYTNYKGKLWAATENGLCCYNRKSDDFSTYILKDQYDNLTGKDVGSFFQDEVCLLEHPLNR